MKKYDSENVKYDTFIDARYHRELLQTVEEDLWVLQEADAEVIHPLKTWQEEQWREQEAHHVARWTKTEVKLFVDSVVGSENLRR